MDKHVLTDQRIFVNGYDLSRDSNAVAINYGADMLETTTFLSDTRVHIGGLKTVQVQIGGFYDASTQDNETFADIGISNSPLSICAEGGNVGNIAYFFKALAGNYSIGGAVGDVLKFELGAGAVGQLIRGVVAHNAADTAVTTSGTGAYQNLGAVSSSQKLYAALHVTNSGGSGNQTLNVTIESDDNTGFTTPTTVLTFAQVGATPSGEFLQLDGPITDVYYRVKYTVAGTGSPSFKFATLFGVM